MSEIQEVSEIITIRTEDGTEVDHRVLLQIAFHDTDRKYMVIAPLDDEELKEIGAVRYEEEEGGELLLHTITDDEEWERVEQAFKEFVANQDEDSQGE